MRVVAAGWRRAVVAVALALTASLAAMAFAASSGAAVGIGGTCGGIAGLTCDSPLWCEPDAGHCSGADIAGKCVQVPDFCAQVLQPVCGCDGKTYNNDCERRRAKVQKAAEGPC